MPTKQQEQQQVHPETPERPPLDAAIAKHVVHTLGQPGNLHQVQVRQLWDHHYRVNILVGADAVSAKVAHSYFLVADGEGNILASTPVIRRQY